MARRAGSADHQDRLGRVADERGRGGAERVLGRRGIWLRVSTLISDGLMPFAANQRR